MRRIQDDILKIALNNFIQNESDAELIIVNHFANLGSPNGILLTYLNTKEFSRGGKVYSPNNNFTILLPIGFYIEAERDFKLNQLLI